MAIEVERLIATLEARLDKFEKALAKQAVGADKQFRKIEQSGSRMEAKLSKLGIAGFKGLAAGAIASVASVLSLQAAIDGAKRALDEFGAIADNARASGLDPETFQELAYQAQQGGVEFGQFSDALATFAKNSGLAVVGKGKMVAALKALNPELLANIQAATTQEERMRLAADAIAAAGNASERAALSVALFGDAGAKLAGVFEGGAAAMRATAVEARRLGIVVSNDLIARADELGDQFDTATKVLDLQFKQALIELAPFLIGTVQLVGNLTAAVRGLIEAFGAMESKSTATLESRAAAIKELLASIGSDITTASGQIVPANPMAVSIGGADPEALKQELAQIEAILEKRKALETLNTPASGAPTYTAADVENREAAAKAAIKQADAVKKLTADLNLERQAMFLTAEQQAALNTVNSAGIDVNSKQGKELVALALANEQLKNSMQMVNDIAQSAVSTFVNDLRQGKSAADALANALGNIANKLIDMALNAAITNLIGGLFGGGGFVKPVTGFGFGKPLANGGTVTPGSVHPVGERGPELFVPSSAGKIIPNNRLGGGSEVVNIRLQDDSGRMADIADQQIRTASGTIVKISVAASEKAFAKRAGKGDYRALGISPGLKRS